MANQSEKEEKEESQLLLGINSVARGLEKDQVSLVVVCGEIRPLILIQHLPQLAFLRQVPFCVLPDSNTPFVLAKPLKFKSLIALAFKKSSSRYDDLINFIKGVIPPLHIPWLQNLQVRLHQGEEEETPPPTITAPTTTTRPTLTTASISTTSELSKLTTPVYYPLKTKAVGPKRKAL